MATPHFMSSYLRENLWKTFAVGEESFTLLAKLYSFSAAHEGDESVAPLETLLLAYAREESDYDEARTQQLFLELQEWFTRDWFAPDDFNNLIFPPGTTVTALGASRGCRLVLQKLIYSPGTMTSNWVKRLWGDALLRNGDDPLAAEVELLFLFDEIPA